MGKIAEMRQLFFEPLCVTPSSMVITPEQQTAAPFWRVIISCGEMSGYSATGVPDSSAFAWCLSASVARTLTTQTSKNAALATKGAK
jgi:hypothetical protein